MANLTFTIEVPESVVVRGEGKEAIRLNFKAIAELPESDRLRAMSEAFMGGLLVTMNNTYNSGGKDLPVADRRANLERRIAAFEGGAWTSRGGGTRDSMEGLMRDAFYNEKGAQDSASRAKLDKAIKETVAAVYGDKEAARFNTFLGAVATQLGRKRAKEGDDEAAVIESIKTQLVEKYEALAESLKASREKELDVIDIDNLI